MGRRKMRFTHPKNWERKKYAKISSPQQPTTSAQCPTTSEHQTASAHQPPLRSSPQQPTASAHQPPLRSPQQPTTSAHQPPLRSSLQQPTASAHQPPLRSPQQPTTSAHQPPLRSPPQQPTTSAHQPPLRSPPQHGRANQNPTVAEALKSTQTLRVVDSVWVDDLTGSNCRGRKRKRKFLETEDCKPLPKRRKRRPSM